MSKELLVSISPHFSRKESVSKIMWTVFFALLPAGAMGVMIFGRPAFFIILVSVITAMLTEAVIQALMHKRITILDGSAALTGLLLAYNLSSSVPLWLPIIGSIFAIAIVKQAFGGLGNNLFNPALAARAFLLASWPKYMTAFPRACTYDAITQATPLTIVKEKMAMALPSYFDLLVGNRGGCIGEVCIWTLLLGAIFLLLKKYISYQIPLSFLGSFALLAWFFGGDKFLSGDVLFSLMTGGIILGAFFMATDYVTNPLTKKGHWVFGIGCGVLTFLIRKWGGYPEGTSYAILMMNAATPIIDRYTKNRIYGSGKAKIK